jgi:hypothetical protein
MDYIANEITPHDVLIRLKATVDKTSHMNFPNGAAAKLVQTLYGYEEILSEKD